MPNSYFICLVDVFFSRRIHSIQLRNKSRYIDWNWMENSVHEHFGVHFYVHLHIIHSQTNHWRRNNKKTSRNEYEKWSEWEPECWVHARQSHSRTHTQWIWPLWTIPSIVSYIDIFFFRLPHTQPNCYISISGTLSCHAHIVSHFLLQMYHGTVFFCCSPSQMEMWTLNKPPTKKIAIHFSTWRVQQRNTNSFIGNSDGMDDTKRRRWWTSKLH